ncbi:hypothetical protein EDD52_10516 [Primorskyibacter sedentarius]|uniref:Hemolysin type calcium-binding protein n=1 Tax=Primorskyibacter sedentarius TaxID=745311 RepID=A0A4R3JGU2_9RHOB|nr:hypothetical protein [Primorskyibacter sedentarius]TCS64456.1 hypothetical protein EDD52_10516 [Primorskyibacter sedentarius]
MVGGIGNDTCYIDNSGDVIEEAPDGGRDTIYSTLSLSLADTPELENLPLIGNATAAWGNDLDNELFADDGIASDPNGHDGSDTLHARNAGVALIGGVRGDHYVLDLLSPAERASVLTNEGPEDGHDRISFAGGSFLLGAHKWIEDIYSVSGASALSGNAANNALFGDADENRIVGGAGDDTLDGGGGTDAVRYFFASGADRLL